MHLLQYIHVKGLCVQDKDDGAASMLQEKEIYTGKKEKKCVWFCGCVAVCRREIGGDEYCVTDQVSHYH